VGTDVEHEPQDAAALAKAFGDGGGDNARAKDAETPDVVRDRNGS
jgi:hypothetical protein